MNLNPQFENEITALPANRVHDLFLWLTTAQSPVESSSQRLTEILEQIQKEDIATCYQVLSELELNDVVSFSIINEFGPTFISKTAFNALSQAITRRLEQAA